MVVVRYCGLRVEVLSKWSYDGSLVMRAFPNDLLENLLRTSKL